jgi:hypothetical protein
VGLYVLAIEAGAPFRPLSLPINVQPPQTTTGVVMRQ